MGSTYPFAAFVRYFVPLGNAFVSPADWSRQQVSLAYSSRPVKSVRTPGGHLLGAIGDPVPSEHYPSQVRLRPRGTGMGVYAPKAFTVRWAVPSLSALGDYGRWRCKYTRITT